jgi:hypothetical protein
LFAELINRGSAEHLAMLKVGALVVFLFCFLLVASVAATPVVPTLGPRNVFSIYEQDAIIVLPENFSCSRTGITYRTVDYSVGSLYSWYFPLFSTGNGTADLRVSAQNSTFTIISLKIFKAPLNDSWYNTSYSLTCKIESNGTAYLNVDGLEYTDIDVNINGTTQPIGYAWNVTDFGLTFQGPADIKIQEYSQSFEPPVSSDQDNRPIYVGALALTSAGVMAALGFFKFERDRKNRKISPLKVKCRFPKGRAIFESILQFSCGKVESMDRLTELRLSITCIYGLFIALVALGQVWVSPALTVTGLVAFAAAAILTTYYVVELED